MDVNVFVQKKRNGQNIDSEVKITEIDFMRYSYELKEDVNEHQQGLVNGIMIKESSVNGKHLSSLEMICMRAIQIM